MRRQQIKNIPPLVFNENRMSGENSKEMSSTISEKKERRKTSQPYLRCQALFQKKPHNLIFS